MAVFLMTLAGFFDFLSVIAFTLSLHSCPWPSLLSVVPSGRLPRNQPSQQMAFPHPKTRQQHDGEEDEPGWRRVIRQHFERAIDIADDGNGADDVNPANDPACVFHVISTPLVGDSVSIGS